MFLLRMVKQKTISTTAPGSSISLDSDTPTWKRLSMISYASLLREVVSLIETLFASEDEVKTICDLQGDDAQTFINAIHEALHFLSLPPRLRGKCLSALHRICSRQALLPLSLQIPICYDRSVPPLRYGGFSDVWKGEYEGRHVAVKVLRVCTSDIGKIASRFCKEVVTWNALCHPNVLPLCGVTMDKYQFAMISEWMVNGNINEFVEAHSEMNPLELLKEVADGLIYIHSQGMVHGDLKWANILIDQDRHARLADFGLLTIVSDPTYFSASTTAHTGGTTRWMSPELLHPEEFGSDHGGGPTKESDCYALGMVIYEVLAGQAPFAPWSNFVVMRKITNGERPGRPEGAAKGMAWFTDDLWKMLGLCWMTGAQNRPGIEVVRECLERVSGTWKPPSQVNEDGGQVPSNCPTSDPATGTKPPIIPEFTISGGIGPRNLLQKISQYRQIILFYHENEPFYAFTTFSPHAVMYDGKVYPTSEHLYQALKFTRKPGLMVRIRTCDTRPNVAFAVGQKLAVEAHPNWKDNEIKAMDIVLFLKFSQHQRLQLELLSTGDAELIKDSDKNSFWGCGADGKGRNELGKALMRLRKSIRAELEGQ